MIVYVIHNVYDEEYGGFNIEFITTNENKAIEIVKNITQSGNIGRDIVMIGYIIQNGKWKNKTVHRLFLLQKI